MVDGGDDSIPQFTKEDDDEFEKLKQLGFPAWSKRDFNNFVVSSSKHGRNTIDKIAVEIQKSPEEVKR